MTDAQEDEEDDYMSDAFLNQMWELCIFWPQLCFFRVLTSSKITYVLMMCQVLKILKSVPGKPFCVSEKKSENSS